jgi:hypothetical protein
MPFYRTSPAAWRELKANRNFANSKRKSQKRYFSNLKVKEKDTKSLAQLDLAGACALQAKEGSDHIACSIKKIIAEAAAAHIAL